MKKMIQTLVCSVVVFNTMPAIAQKIDEARMQRDIAVAENVLGTLIKQQFEKCVIKKAPGFNECKKLVQIIRALLHWPAS